VLFGFPAVMLLYTLSRGAFRWISLLGVAVSALAIFRTGSRAGLLMLAAIMLIIFFRASMANKMKLFTAGTALGLLGISMASHEARQRYLTIFNPSAAETGDAQSAIESREARKLHLKQSIRLTLKKPIFGVGPGNFPSASADDAEELGVDAAWRNTHNAYTQVSSEAGVPGLMLFLAIIAYCVTTTSRIYRMAKKRSDMQEILHIAFCLRLMMIIYIINGCFDSNAYQYHLPVFSALIFAFDTAVRREMAAAPRTGAPQPLRDGNGGAMKRVAHRLAPAARPAS
jgi:O-antigen ligase